MTDRMTSVLGPGNVAVITGAAKGIGAALATALAARGMRLGLLDRDGAALAALAARLPTETVTVAGDVTREADLIALRDRVRGLGPVQLLVNNAAVGAKAGPWAPVEDWRRLLDINFFSLVAMQNLFVPDMIRGDLPGAIVNLGSKEGITTPPGNAAYSVAKAGVKVMTEQLEHELRNLTAGRVSAHLLVPGYTWTPMNFPGLDPVRDEKPRAPWTAEELVAHALPRLERGEFYIIAQDNDVSSALDAKRIEWAAQDMIQGRPALSRWHADWKQRFADWVKG